MILWAHRAGEVDALDIRTLSSRWLEAEERRDDLVSVVVDLISREGDLTDRGMDDPRLVDLEVDLTRLHFLDSSSDVVSYRTALRGLA